MKRDFDLIVYGATGYTGRVSAEYLATSYRGDVAPSWAIGRLCIEKGERRRRLSVVRASTSIRVICVGSVRNSALICPSFLDRTIGGKAARQAAL